SLMVISKLTSRTSFERLPLGSIRSLEASGKATKECGTRDLWSLSSMARLRLSSSMPRILRPLAETLRKPCVCRMRSERCWMQQADQQHPSVSEQSVALRGIGHTAQTGESSRKKGPLDRPDASSTTRLIRSIGIRPIIFSVNCYIATILALFISFSLDLKSPGWAMTTVYLTSQPLLARCAGRFE